MPAPALQVAADAAERVGRYELVTELARSPLGGLWAARVSAGGEEGRLVSLRRILRRDDDPTLVERVSEAAFAAMEVRHPKIVAVLDVVVTEREVAVASEYVDAQVLSTLMNRATEKRSPLPVNVALRIGVDLLQALRAAHTAWGETASTRGLYGGLNPDNVMVATYGDVMLADLGIASVLSAAPHTRQVAEAVAYCAPEQLAFDASADERTDVFTLGVLLWELLINRPLFGSQLGAHDAATVSERVRAAVVPRIDAVGHQGPPIPAPIVELVARALQRDPSGRFATLGAMLGALLAQGRGVVGTPEHVVMALDRLARNDIEARRASLGSLAGGRALGERESGLPESGRPTRRPPPPEAPAEIKTGGTPALTGRAEAGATPGAGPAPDRSDQPRKHEPKPTVPQRRAEPSPPAKSVETPKPALAGVPAPAPVAPPKPPPMRRPPPPKPSPKGSHPPPPPRAETAGETVAEALPTPRVPPPPEPTDIAPLPGAMLPLPTFSESPPLPPEPVNPTPSVSLPGPGKNQPPDAPGPTADAKSPVGEAAASSGWEPATNTAFSGPRSSGVGLVEADGRRRRARRLAIGVCAAVGVLLALGLLAVVFRSPSNESAAAASSEPVPRAVAREKAPESPQKPSDPAAEAEPSTEPSAASPPGAAPPEPEPEPEPESAKSSAASGEGAKPAPPREREPSEERRPPKKGYRPRGI